MNSIIKTSNENTRRPNSSKGIQKLQRVVKTMTDNSTQARRISTQTVSDDLNELYSRMMLELDTIQTLRSRLNMIRIDEVHRLREIKELEEKKKIELNRQKMRLIDEENAKVREVERQKWLTIMKAKARELKKKEMAKISKAKEDEKEAEEAKMKAADDLRAAERLKGLQDEKNASRKRKCEKEKEPNDWKKDFGFKKPKPKLARGTYKVPGSPLTYYKKPNIGVKDCSKILCDTIVISDDELSQKISKVVVPKRIVHSKDLNFYKRKIVESSSESEEEDDDSDDDVDISVVNKYNILPIGLYPVDIDASIPGTSTKRNSPKDPQSFQDDLNYWANFIHSCENDPSL